jgi:hypothetical protein
MRAHLPSNGPVAAHGRERQPVHSQWHHPRTRLCGRRPGRGRRAWPGVHDVASASPQRPSLAAWAGMRAELISSARLARAGLTQHVDRDIEETAAIQLLDSVRTHHRPHRCRRRQGGALSCSFTRMLWAGLGMLQFVRTDVQEEGALRLAEFRRAATSGGLLSGSILDAVLPELPRNRAGQLDYRSLVRALLSCR